MSAAIAFADLPDHLRAGIAAEWWVLQEEAGHYFNSLTAAGRWEIITAFVQTNPTGALSQYLAAANAQTLRDLGHLLLARSRALEAAA